MVFIINNRLHRPRLPPARATGCRGSVATLQLKLERARAPALPSPKTMVRRRRRRWRPRAWEGGDRAGNDGEEGGREEGKGGREEAWDGEGRGGRRIAPWPQGGKTILFNKKVVLLHSCKREREEKKEEIIVSDGWTKHVVVRIEGDIEYGWVQKNWIYNREPRWSE